MTRQINPQVDTFHGINNALDPCSAQYRQGMVYEAINERINESGVWDKARELSDASMGDTTVVDIPVAVGNELVTNGDFAAAGNWDYGGDWEWFESGKFANIFGPGQGVLSQSISITAGKIYQVAYDNNYNNESDVITGYLGGTPFEVSFGSQTAIVVCGSDDSLIRFSVTATNTIGIDDVSVKEVYPHIKHATIKDSSYIAKSLKYNTPLEVGTNKYAYMVDDDLGSNRECHHWDGTDRASAVAFVDNETAFNYGLAGLARPTATIHTEENTFDDEPAGNAIYGGRQEPGRYYYTYTLFDTVRKVESLPASVVDYTMTAYDWSQYYESSQFPVISVKPEVQSLPTVGSGRCDANTKVRVYRSRRTQDSKSVYNPPNKLFFLGDMDYNAGLTGVTFDDDTNTWTKVGGFANVSAGDVVYAYDKGDSDIPDKAFIVVSSATDDVMVTQDDGTEYSDETTGMKISFMTINDYSHDKELVEEYEGRGSVPPQGIDFLASFANRMYYFVGNTVYWSSSGRPEEVAQEYTLNFSLLSAVGETVDSSLDVMPKLSTGGYGEAKYEISELAGETVVGAYPWKNRLYLWTEEGTSGYLDGTYSVEGVRFYLLRNGIGLISDKVLAKTPYGLFGADRDGMWQLNSQGELFRISKGIIDFSDDTKVTYADQSTLKNSFGVWSPELDEYIWCMVNSSQTNVYNQIAYNPVREVFSGFYRYSGIIGGCSLPSSAGYQNYLTDGKTFGSDYDDTLVGTLQFWMGQGSIESIKENLEVEIIYSSITANKDVTVNIYQNNISSTTGASSLLGITHNDDNLVGVVKPNGSGRMFLLSISVPVACQAPILALNYIANFVPWNEKRLR